MTAVEYLIDQMIKQDYFDESVSSINLQQLLKEAKRIEKRQIQNAFNDGEMNIHNSKRDEGFEYGSAEQYYDKTFNKAE